MPIQFTTQYGELIITPAADGGLPVTFALKGARLDKVYEFTATASWLVSKFPVLFEPGNLLAVLDNEPNISAEPEAKAQPDTITITYSAICCGKAYPVPIILYEQNGIETLFKRMALLEQEVRDLKKQNDQLSAVTTMTMSVPFDRLLADAVGANSFLHDHYMTREYHSWVMSHPDVLVGDRTGMFINSPEARLLFNLHWLGHVQKLEFIGPAKRHADLVDIDGLWFEAKEINWPNGSANCPKYRLTSLAGLSRIFDPIRRSIVFSSCRDCGFSTQYSDGRGGWAIAIVVY